MMDEENAFMELDAREYYESLGKGGNTGIYPEELRKQAVNRNLKQVVQAKLDQPDESSGQKWLLWLLIAVAVAGFLYFRSR